MSATAQSIASRADEFAGALPTRVAPSELKRLSRLDPARALLHVALEWACILGAAALCWRFWHPALYVLTVAFIGARQHALLILMHDGSHFRLLPNRRLNDWLGEVFLAWPFGAITMRDYRRSHFLHHRFVNTDRDPDWVRKRNADWEFPKSPLALVRLLLTTLSGVGLLRQLRYAREVTGSERKPARSDAYARELAIGRVAFLAALVAAIVAFDLWVPFLLFWVVPFVTWTQLVLHLRSIAEHFAMPPGPAEDLYAQTRNTFAGPLDRVFVGSKNIGYHLDHHLYPSVPFYRLPELHAVLMGDLRYRRASHHTRGYWGVLRECVTPLERRSE